MSQRDDYERTPPLTQGSMITDPAASHAEILERARVVSQQIVEKVRQVTGGDAGFSATPGAVSDLQ